MWSEPKQELREHEVAISRPTDGSELVMMDDRIIEVAARSQPAVNNLNVTKSSRVHIGPKFVSVTQNVDNIEVVKDLPFYRYVWDVAKSTTRAERLSCAAAMTVLIICIILIVYFTVFAKKNDQLADVAPHEWFITRDMWLSPHFETTPKTTEFEPLRLVIISHSVSPECDRFANCAAEMRNLQSYFQRTLQYDLPYNFLIGNDGRVYEGRGWSVVGAHTIGYNSCTMAVAFIGDYREGLPSYSKVTPLQIERAHMLLEVGVKLGHLHPQFQVLGAKDLTDTHSPGGNIYKEIRTWPNYAFDNVFKKRSCQEIYELFKNENKNATKVL